MNEVDREARIKQLDERRLKKMLDRALRSSTKEEVKALVDAHIEEASINKQ